MPYQKQGFENGQVLEDKHLIKIEEGILELQDNLSDIETITDGEIDQICQ